jgi:hypothetical protein
MNVGLVMAAAGLAIAVLGLPVTSANWRRARGERTSGRFTSVCERVRWQQPRLNSAALSAAPKEWQFNGVPMLTRPGWILPRPIPLESVRLEWREAPPDDDGFEAARRNARRMMPRRGGNGRPLSYGEALAEFGGMPNLFNGSTYRPIEMEVADGGLRLTFTPGRYFDHLDTTEVLAYEAAALDLAGKRPGAGGRFRRYLDDPFDLRRRSASLGVITLTVRRADRGSGFYMHQRDGRHVVTAPETIHAIPAGEFAPADVGLQAQRTDFDLWHTIMREYAEEFLDLEEAYGRGGRPLDYERRSPFKELNAARRSGRLQLHVLGIGLDPLTWKPEILTVCAIDAATFDRIFAKMVTRGREGTILDGPRGKGIPFDVEAVHLYADSPNTRSAARACLKLAWLHRAALGLV